MDQKRGAEKRAESDWETEGSDGLVECFLHDCLGKENISIIDQWFFSLNRNVGK